jgi:hypothetical protein
MTVAYPRKLRGELNARDILSQVVRQPEIHMITLNRYRFSEQRSCRDLTNLIEVLDGQPRDLVQDLSHHLADEARHAVWLTDLLCDLDQPVGKPPGTSYIDEFDRLIVTDPNNSPEDIVIEALAAINVTEKRGCEYFAAHIHALDAQEPTAVNQKVRDTIAKILPEEAAHVRWGNRRLAAIAKQSPAHQRKVEQAKQKFIAIEHAAFESGMDILAGAEFRRAENIAKIAETLPLWQRPQYLMEHLPQAVFNADLNATRLNLVKNAWERDPVNFVEKFIPMFFSPSLKTTAKTVSQL